jgi:site-specific DNA-methyltransferase (adenine-specific)
MNLKHPLYSALGIDASNRQEAKDLARLLNAPLKELDFYDTNNILPDKNIIDSISLNLSISKEELMLKMGIYNLEIKKIISDFAPLILKKLTPAPQNELTYTEVFNTQNGRLLQGDCLAYLSEVEDETFDLIFADPPFNLNKFYPSGMDDNLSILEYINWTEKWLGECIRALKKGGSLFLWNIPKWNTYFSEFLNQRLTFRHWITTDLKLSLPIQGRLYPSHYSLLYYIKGEKPNTFIPDRLQMETCPKCYGDLKDYGGYKDKMNPLGVNMTDVWYDIPPVRHSKYKGRKDANELSIKLLDRIIEMSTKPGDLVFDPFGGSGTSYIAAEIKKRRWVGIEIGPVDDIIARFDNLVSEEENISKYRENYNKLFPDKIKAKRKQNGLWTVESIREQKEISENSLDLFSEISPEQLHLDE